jgi:hypothetical protein
VGLHSANLSDICWIMDSGTVPGFYFGGDISRGAFLLILVTVPLVRPLDLRVSQA